MPNDLCFVLMPFGKKPDASSRMVDFDAVYQQLIAPAIREAGLTPLRADEELRGGLIHTPMFERLLFCEFAVADLTSANANVFYELGVRHAVRPCSTVLLFAEGGGQLPFDVAPLRAVPYRLTPGGTPADADAGRQDLVKRLNQAQEDVRKQPPEKESPLFQLVEGYPGVALDHSKTDDFQRKVRYSAEKKEMLARARDAGLDALRAAERDLGPWEDLESGVLIDLLLSYRDAKGWQDMIDLVKRMPEPLAATAMVQEQLGLALNRAGRGEEAEMVLQDLIKKRGASSETYGILGRVHKDRWEAASKAGRSIPARGLLEKAIEAYLKGFEADWRDAYPGVNAVTLMELKEPPDPRRHDLVPVVAYAVERKIAAGEPEYWDYATLVELAVLAKNEAKTVDALSRALACRPKGWQCETTARNLRLIREARERRSEDVPWVKEIEEELAKAAS